MSAKSDKKRADDLAKRTKKLANKRAKRATVRKNRFSNKIASKDRTELAEKFGLATTDLATARDEVSSAMNRIAADNKSRNEKSVNSSKAISAALASELSGIAGTNDAANMDALSKMGLSSVGTLNSGRNSQLQSMLAQMQGNFAEQNLNTMQRDSEVMDQGFQGLNRGAHEQMTQAHLNERNQGLNDVNRDLSDTYDQSKFDLKETLLGNKYSFKDTLHNNQQEFERAREYEREQARARSAAYRNVRGSGYGYGGYGVGGGSAAPSMAPTAPASSSRAEVTANNLKMFRNQQRGGRGGFWDTTTPEKGLTRWNHTFN